MDFLSLSCNRGISKLGNFIAVLWQLQVSSVHSNIITVFVIAIATPLVCFFFISPF